MNGKVAKYTTGHILRIFNMKMDKCRDWHRKGFIEPTVPSGGQGYKAGYTLDDLYGIALFIKLLDKGYKRELASQIVKSTKGSELLMFAEFVLYQTVKKDGKLEIKPTYLSGGDCTIHVTPQGITTTLTDEGKYIKPDGEEEAASEYETWEDMFIINLVSLRHTVDTALADK